MEQAEIDLLKLARLILRRKLLVITIALVIVVSMGWYAKSLPDIYRSEVLLSPVESGAAGGIGKLGGLASIAGVDLSGGNSKADLAIEVLKSRRFLMGFIKKHELEAVVLASESWDNVSGDLIYDESIYDNETGVWSTALQERGGGGPSLQKAYDHFVKNFQVLVDKKNGFVRISYEHPSPFVAHDVVGWLVVDLDSDMRASALRDANNNIAYLNNKSEGTSVVEARAVFYSLLEEQIKSRMFAEVSAEFVFRVIDPAIVPEAPAGPFRLLYLIFGIAFGFGAGMFASLFVAWRKGELGVVD
ncbi:Wzz/FepE/Etk N-terminal domain-containing protein [Agaribacterium haliotis]|uniref:Wzz/FepE/Etk N-terminal domain-containing protein n=1 Tax=Agaribacterium haliotis TaxID=2013869 RepID=UPI000BB55365|nr:Wzz/FepE/Etk N-terminal domain-containing protein [Agaribacterium haliotis]